MKRVDGCLARRQSGQEPALAATIQYLDIGPQSIIVPKMVYYRYDSLYTMLYVYTILKDCKVLSVFDYSPTY